LCKVIFAGEKWLIQLHVLFTRTYGNTEHMHLYFKLTHSTTFIYETVFYRDTKINGILLIPRSTLPPIHIICSSIFSFKNEQTYALKCI
jgi:hypothetical protein